MKQLKFKIKPWGGKRKGSGRKNRSGQLAHSPREKVTGRHPLHVTIKVRKGLSSLRGFKLEKAFRSSVQKAKAKGLRVLEYSIERDHVHMFLEADDNTTLRSGMASFAGRYGKLIRRSSMGSGAVFNGRYHMNVLKTPRQTRHALRYVLLNHSQHQGHGPHPDAVSSSQSFDQWKDLMGWRSRAVDPRPDCLSRARSWLAREGWKRSTG